MANPLWDALTIGRQKSKGVLVQSAGGGKSGERLTDDAFLQLTGQLANTLIAAGVRFGDRVAVQVPKSIEALALYIACIRCGAVFLPLNTAYTESELDYFIGDAEPALLVVDLQCIALAQKLIDGRDCRLHTLGACQEGTLLKLAESHSSHFETVDCAQSDLAAILYTSGTTGRSKGAMLTHLNLLSNAQTLIDIWQFSTDDVLLHALPIFHTHGLFVACNTVLFSGASMIFLPTFDSDTVLDQLPHATCMMGVPTFYTRLLGDPRLSRELVANMRLFISGSAPLLSETHSQFEQLTGHSVLERYGMTETNMNTSNPYFGERKAGTVGLPLPGVEVRICDPVTLDSLPAGAVGMLLVRGSNVFCGYWRMPEKTEDELLKTGFFITGDLASLDANGYVTIVGRNKDLIISGGFNIYPKEIELVLDRQACVMESAVVGAPHADFGEAVVAFVVLAASVADTVEVLDSLNSGMRQSVARFKHPKRFVIVDALPRNAMGKVQKSLLRAQVVNYFVQNDT